MSRRLADNRVSSVHNFEVDRDISARVAAHTCKSCWYFQRNRIGGAAMTTWYCGICGARRIHGSTAHNKICDRCATEHKLCVQCGGDIMMRARRRKWPTPIQRSPDADEDGE
jgi:hypothetical protein